MPDPVATMPNMNLQYAPTGLLDSIYKYLTYPYENQLAYAQLQLQAEQARNQAAAAGFGAQASVLGAQIGAQGGLAQQKYATQGNLRGIQAQLQNDIALAAGGDRNAAMRLQAQLAQAAQIQNQQARLQTAQLASSTGLRDALAARNFVRGVGNQPAFGSAMLAGPLQDITAPTVGYANYGPAATVDMNLPDVSLPNVQMPNFSLPGGAGITIPKAPDFSSLLSDVFKNVTPTAPVTSAQAGTNQPSALQAWQAANPGRPVTDFLKQFNPGLPQMAGGGSLAPGQAAMVGERGPEILSLRPDGSIEVLPLTRGYATGGTINPTFQQQRYTQSQQRITGQTPTPPTSLTPVTTPPPDAGGGTSPKIEIKPDGTTTIGASANPGPPQYTFPTSPTQTGQELMGLPATQALLGNQPKPYNAAQTFSLPEYGLYNLPGIAQSAALFRPGVLNPQESADLMQLLQLGYNVPPEVIQSIVNAYQPGFRQTFSNIGF